MAADNFVVIRRTISQTLVPYKEVQEKLLLKRSRERQCSSGRRPHFGSTTTVATQQYGGAQQWKDSTKRVTFDESGPNGILERSRSEVCLRRKSSYVRETSLDVFYEERREEGTDAGSVKPILRQRRGEVNSKSSPRRGANAAKLARPQSDFFPEFKVKFKNAATKERTVESSDGEERLGQYIAVLRREMLSLRQQDGELLKQLTTLNERIEDLKELSRVHGPLFQSCDDEGDVGERLNTSRPDVQINRISRTTDSPRRGGDSEGYIRYKSVNGDNGEREDGVRRLQETSFEYIEVPSSVPVKQRKSGKQLQSGMPGDVTRKSSLHLERKSVSCQFLDSRGDARGTKRYSGHFESLGKRENSTQMSQQCNRKAKQKSLSMCHLRRTTKPEVWTKATDVSTKATDVSTKATAVSTKPIEVSTKATEVSTKATEVSTKATEVSTSESECSTSGCYGGSSTGSELDLERHVTYAESSTEEEREKSEKEKVFALKATKKKRGYHPPTTTQPGRFRKQIVSV